MRGLTILGQLVRYTPNENFDKISYDRNAGYYESNKDLIGKVSAKNHSGGPRGGSPMRDFTGGRRGDPLVPFLSKGGN